MELASLTLIVFQKGTRDSSIELGAVFYTYPTDQNGLVAWVMFSRISNDLDAFQYKSQSSKIMAKREAM